MDKQHHYCRVCGFFNTTAPWGEDGQTPTYEICPCCGVEYGNEDYKKESVLKFREQWLAGGAKWFQPGVKPDNWNLDEQIKHVPPEFL